MIHTTVATLLVVGLYSVPLNTPQPGRSLQRPDTSTTGVLSGRVVDGDGLPLPGIEVVLTGGGMNGARSSAPTSRDGSFRFDGLPAPGSYRLSASSPDMTSRAEIVATIGDRLSAQVELRLRLSFSEEVTVTGTREAELKRETPATIGTVTRASLEGLRPAHPSEAMGLVPGVWINTTGGEGHMTAIRHPLTTNPVYLYLEDGVPTRSTGFFNHNALYEVNLAGADGIEVTKVPASALYGSDAIGGVVNVLTRSALDGSGVSGQVERGVFGWRRVVADGGVSSVGTRRPFLVEPDPLGRVARGYRLRSTGRHAAVGSRRPGFALEGAGLGQSRGSADRRQLDSADGRLLRPTRAATSHRSPSGRSGRSACRLSTNGWRGRARSMSSPTCATTRWT